MKIIFRLLVVLVLLVVAVVVIALMSLDGLAKAAIEKGSTFALGVPTTLETADVGVFSGEFAMLGLNVDNPEGFDTPHFLHLGSGVVALSVASLREDTIELPHLTLDSIDMNLQRTSSGSNYKVILDSLKRFEGGESKPEDAGGTRFVIRKVQITDVNVHVNLIPEGGDLTKVDVPIDEIILTDVGSGTTGGVLLSDLSGVLIKAIIAAAIEKGGGLIPADIAGELTAQLAQLEGLGDFGMDIVGDVAGQVDDLTGQATDALGDVGSKVDDLGKNLGDKADDAIGNLGGLLGGDKDK